MKSYVNAVQNHRWVMDSLEAYLNGEPDQARLDTARLIRAPNLGAGRPLSDQEILVGLSALSSIGVVTEKRSTFVLNKPAFTLSTKSREVIRAVLDGLDDPPNRRSDAELCGSLPPTIGAAARLVLRDLSLDLRAGLLDVIASAKESVIVASPFWDASTAVELKSLLEKRVKRGLHCS